MSLNLKVNVYLTEATEYIPSDGNLTWSVVRRADFKTACHLPTWSNNESLSSLRFIIHAVAVDARLYEVWVYMHVIQCHLSLPEHKLTQHSIA
jgi:hypothetical protein